jgi:hypothetical protein
MVPAFSRCGIVVLTKIVRHGIYTCGLLCLGLRLLEEMITRLRLLLELGRKILIPVAISIALTTGKLITGSGL